MVDKRWAIVIEVRPFQKRLNRLLDGRFGFGVD
jgi:hypothetical protein